MEDLATFNLQNIRLGLIYGSQIGLAVLMLVTVLLLAQPGKRRTPVYVLNVLALIFDLLRGSMMAVWLDSMWNHPYVFFAQDYSRITGEDKANSIAADVFKTLELSTVLVSLIFQVRVIMSTTTSAKRALVTSTAFVVAMVTICVQVATTAVNADNIAHPAPLADDALQLKLSDVCVILQLVSVGFFLIIFTAKLGIVIHQRYKLGYSKFGPMQIVFIGSLQSMLIPGKRFSTRGD
jgi:pheromone alpha factor receptor